MRTSEILEGPAFKPVGFPARHWQSRVTVTVIEPVMDWDRVGTEGRAQFAVVAPVVAQAVSGSVHSRGGGRGCGSRGEGALASFTLVEGGLGCREKSVVTAGRDQGIVVAK